MKKVKATYFFRCGDTQVKYFINKEELNTDIKGLTFARFDNKIIPVSELMKVEFEEGNFDVK